MLPSSSLYCALVLLALPLSTTAGETTGVRPLLMTSSGDLHLILPKAARHLIDPVAIERFLAALDGTPPDWGALYGRGHHGSDFEERLFQLNRERDAARRGKNALEWRVTFIWPGELSTYDPESGGFAVAMGPALIRTEWGIVRFKPDELPSNLSAVPHPEFREQVLHAPKGTRTEIRVAMTGRLVPEESLVYDFSHEEEGQGFIMPVVRVEELAYLFVE